MDLGGWWTYDSWGQQELDTRLKHAYTDVLMPTLRRGRQEQLRLSWNILLGSVITGWTDQETGWKVQSRRQTKPSTTPGPARAAPGRDLTLRSAPGRLVTAFASPLPREQFPSTRPEAGRCSFKKAKKVGGRKGTGKRRLTFPRGTKAAASRTWAGEWLCLQRPPGLRFPEIPDRSTDTTPPPARRRQ